MTEDTAPQTDKPKTDKMNSPQTCTALYALFALSMALPVMFSSLPVMVLGFLVLTAAIIAAYAQRDAARGTVYESHIRWLIRTFWIGGGIYLPIVTIIGSIYLATHIDTQALIEAAQNGTEATPANVANIIAQHYGKMIVNTTRITGGIFTLWWVVRCLSGYLVLRRNKAIANPGSWI
ncbi:MAG: hypothetical protein GC185_05305 [Alphaproteobacteria bacterium]|nr:hypothetical protein [Alphaproteobacteria bacterium]